RWTSSRLPGETWIRRPHAIMTGHRRQHPCHDRSTAPTIGNLAGKYAAPLDSSAQGIDAYRGEFRTVPPEIPGLTRYHGGRRGRELPDTACTRRPSTREGARPATARHRR